MDRQIIHILHFDFATGQNTNRRWNGLTGKVEGVVPMVSVIRCSQGEWIVHLWSIRHNRPLAHQGMA
jgi:hypothetical protein